MTIEHVRGCCGVREIIELNEHRDNAKGAMVAFKQQTRADHRFRYAFFTQAGNYENGYGEVFAAFIREHKLGDVVETDFHENPNSGNPLKMWVWTVNHDKLRKWNVVRKCVVKKVVKEVKNG